MDVATSDNRGSSDDHKIAVSVNANAGQTFILTAGRDRIRAGAGDDTFVATAGTLSHNDQIDGGGGTNRLSLAGGGSFDLSIPDKLDNIKIVQAQEAAGAAAQVVTLREETNFTVNVAADPSGNPAAGITIIGARNTDVINLAAGHDTVILGSSREIVNGAGGNNVFQVNGDTIGASINGGGGQSRLLVTGGGTVVMGSSIANIASVQLQSTTRFTANAISGLQIIGSADGRDVIPIGAPSQQVVGGGANETVRASAANAVAQVGGLGAGSILEITSGGSVTLNAATSVETIQLDAATVLQLNGLSFIHAIGSTAADTITAGGSNQILTGGRGADTLAGFAGGLDIFRDTAAGLNGDAIRGFVAGDQIDITDLGFAAAQLKIGASEANTLVTVSAGARTTSFTMTGSFSAAKAAEF